MLVEAEIRTFAIFPLVTLGSWLGCLLVFFPQKKYFEPIDLRQLKVLVDQATITLYNLQLLEVEAESRHEAEQSNQNRCGRLPDRGSQVRLSEACLQIAPFTGFLIASSDLGLPLRLV